MGDASGSADNRTTLLEAVVTVRQHTSLAPRIGLVLGSGLGSLVDAIDVEAEVPHFKIAGLRPSTVAGHSGRLILGHLAGVPIAALAGRSHYYEHGDAPATVMGIRLLQALGCSSVFLTAAAGGLNTQFRVGDLMLVNDHICLPAMAGQSPLVGDTAEGRFTSLVEAYDPELRRCAMRVSDNLGQKLPEGIYAQAAGPQYETPAEQRLLRLLGADAVGMSVAAETIVARRLGMRVMAVVCITNIAGTDVTHSEVLAASQLASEHLQKLIRGVVEATKCSGG